MTRAFWSFALLLVTAAPAATAQDAGGTSLHGEIVDPATYLRDGRRGAEMTDLTYEAVDGGQTLAFLDGGSGALYLLLADAPGEDPNELAYDYVNKPVNVIGTVYERAGVKGIVLTQVEEADVKETPEEPPADAGASPAPEPSGQEPPQPAE